MDGPIQNIYLPNTLNRWPHTECFAKHAKWMAPYRMIIQMYYMDGPIQYVFPHILNGWPHTQCFSKHTKWMAPYRMFFHTHYMDGPIQNYFPNVLNG